jgi:hypothetical protein
MVRGKAYAFNGLKKSIIYTGKAVLQPLAGKKTPYTPD